MNRAMLGRMVLRTVASTDASWPPGTVLVAVAGDLAEATAALRAGADVLDLSAAPAEVLTAVLARHPGVPVCAPAPDPDIAGDAAAGEPAAPETAAPETAAPETAAHATVPGETAAGETAAGETAAGETDVICDCDRWRVTARPDQVPAIIAAGLAALVDADHAAELAAISHTSTTAAGRPAGPDASTADPDASPFASLVAIAALSSWLGARAVRTRHPAPVRRALDMADSVRGIRPPARTVRGLA